jgi:hypothetical protein
LFWNHLLPIDGYAPQGDIYEAPPQGRDNHLPPWHAQPPEIAACQVFLASDEASFATGAGRAPIQVAVRHPQGQAGEHRIVDAVAQLFANSLSSGSGTALS